MLILLISDDIILTNFNHFTEYVEYKVYNDIQTHKYLFFVVKKYK